MVIKEHTFTIWGSKVLVFETGNPRGETILMYDGWLGSWQAFLKIIPFLENDYRIVIVAIPGFGESEELRGAHTIKANTELVREVADRLGLVRFHYLGLSFGAGVGVRLASMCPGRVLKLILQGLPMFYQDSFIRKPALWIVRMGACVFLRRPAHAVFGWALRSKLFFRTIFYFRRWSETDAKRKMFQFSRVSGRAAVETARDITKTDFRPLLRRISVPTLVVDGDRTFLFPKPIVWIFDTFFFPPLVAAKFVYRLLPRSRLVIIPHASHLVPTGKPKEFAEAILDFLKS